MSAFKVLNLKTFSSRVIYSLLFLSLGLISLVLAEGISSPHLEILLTVSYALYGDIFYAACSINGKNHTLAVLLSSLIFVLSFICALTLFRFSLYITTALISAFCIFFSVLLFKLLFSRSRFSAFKLLPHIALYGYIIAYSLHAAIR